MPPRFSAFIATSLDGYIARPDGTIDWLSVVERPGESYGYDAFFASIDTVVLGRRTYDTVRSFPEWPFGDKRVIVLTNRPVTPLHGEALFAGPVSTLAAALAAATRVHVDGGTVIRQFLTAGLLTDLTLSIIPTLLGSGIRLFEAGVPERRLELVSQRAWSSGLVQMEYRI